MANIIFKKGATSATSLPTATTEGTLYFDETKQGIYLDTNTAATGGNRITLSEWTNTAKLNTDNVFEGTIKTQGLLGQKIANTTFETGTLNGAIQYFYQVNRPTTNNSQLNQGLFDATSNANGILMFNLHTTENNKQYFSQLGLSSNGNLYYRPLLAISTGQSNTTIYSSYPWKKIAFDSDITTALNNFSLNHTLTIGNYTFNGSADVTIPIYNGAITAGLDILDEEEL